MNEFDLEQDNSEFDLEQQDSHSTFQKMLNAVTPSQENKQFAQDIGESALDFSKGVAGGITMNAADELGGLLSAGAETMYEGVAGAIPGTDEYQLREQGIPTESFLDKYRGYQQASQDSFKEAEERSPVLNTIGQIGGGITSGVALGGALNLGGAPGKIQSISSIARNSGKSKAALELLKRGGMNYLKAAPAIGLEAGLTSEKQLIGENAQPMEVAKDVAGGMAFGLPMVMGMQGISDVIAPGISERMGKITSKIKDIAEESPLARQAKIAYEKYGKIGRVNPRSEKAILEGVPSVEGGTPFSRINSQRAEGITNKVLAADKELGTLVGSSLDDATAAGARVNAQDIIKNLMDDITTAAQELPGLTTDKNFEAAVSKVLNRNYTNATPREIKAAMDDITATVDRISASKYPSPELEQIPNLLKKVRKALDQRLKDTVPEYRDAAERFYQFRRTYMEQPISGKYSPDLDEMMYGNLQKGEKKLVEGYEDLVSRTTADSQNNEGIEATYSRMNDATKKFQQEELSRLQAGKIKEPVMPGADQFMSDIKYMADDAAVRRATRKTQESQGGGSVGLKDLSGFAQTGRGAVLTTSYLAGRAVTSKPAVKLANMGRNLYNAPAETLHGLAAKLESNPALQMFGKALREGLQNSDSAKKNAALFTIMQNPHARALIESEDENEGINP